LKDSSRHEPVISQKIDKKFFEETYRTYWRKLFGICLHHTQDEILSEEIVQEIFRSLWERRETFEITGPIENYLVRAAKMEIMDYFRTASRRQKIRQTVLSDFTESDHSTEQHIYANALENRINELVDRLPLQCREVYTQSRITGLSNQQIASTLSISVKTVEYHMTRALTFLRSNLSGYEI
jgi:RNA polymerase sigma-70 factor (ECF subfamily)